MRIVHGDSGDFTTTLTQVRPASHAYVTIGVFDGVHRGHQRLISRMVQAAHAINGMAIVLTFEPHPAITLATLDDGRADAASGRGQPEVADVSPPVVHASAERRQPFTLPPLLTTVEERAEVLADLGLDVLIVLPFTPATAHTTATEFVEALIHHLHLKQLWGGPDLAIGHRREGDIPFLRQLGAEKGFTVHVVKPMVWEGALVSSSRVRAALEAGDIPQAAGCLGRPYRLTGSVVRGREVGHSIGIPTANIASPPRRLIPASGVYACLAHIKHLGTYSAVTNIGVRPTFDSPLNSASSGRRTPVVEAHLLDFDADLYGQTLALDFIARLRDERAFPTPDALVKQIHGDVDDARTALNNVKGGNPDPSGEQLRLVQETAETI